MSRGYLFKVDAGGQRRQVLEYRNAHAGFDVIWETVAPVLLGSSFQEAGYIDRMFAALHETTHPSWARIALAVTHEQTWVRRDHLLRVAESLEQLTQHVHPWATTDLLRQLAAELREIVKDPFAVGVHFYWYSIIKDFAVRQVLGEGPLTEDGEESCEQVECNFLDPQSLKIHGIFEAFEQIPDLG